MSLELEEFLLGFFEETDEQLGQIEEGLLLLEKSYQDPDLLNTIFRAAHTIKGNSGMLGLPEIANFTHRVEELLDHMRDGAVSPTEENVDLLLRSTDCLRELVNCAKQGLSCETEESTLLAVQLESALAVSEEERAQSGSAQEMPRYEIRFTPYESLVHRGVDPLLLIESLPQVGKVLSLEVLTDGVPTLKEFDTQTCYLGWRVELETRESFESIEEIFEFVDDDGEVLITRLNATPAIDSEPATSSPAAISAQLEHPSPEVSGKQDNAPASTDKPATPRQGTVEESNESIRVSLKKVEHLINTVGELVIANSVLNQTIAATGAANQLPLIEAMALVDTTTRDLQEQVMAVRLLPMSTVFRRLPRLVRDLASELRREVDLQICGEDTEVDKQVIEEIQDPLVHLVRNAIDHGLETPEQRLAAGKPAKGVLRISAFHDGGSVAIEIKDDGRGLNTEKILAKAIERGLVRADEQLTDRQIHALIFQAGFSTAAQVTKVSGRGVGMDVVRKNIENLSGVVELDSTFGKGCTLTIKLPLTMAILDGLTVGLAGEIYIIPLLSVIESIRLNSRQVQTVAGKKEVILVRGEPLPLIRLHQRFGVSPASNDPCEGLVIILEHQNSRVGLLVDELHGQQQVVMKSVEKNYQKVEGVGGATILGDGRVAFILDVAGLTRGQ